MGNFSLTNWFPKDWKISPLNRISWIDFLPLSLLGLFCYHLFVCIFRECHFFSSAVRIAFTTEKKMLLLSPSIYCSIYRFPPKSTLFYLHGDQSFYSSQWQVKVTTKNYPQRILVAEWRSALVVLLDGARAATDFLLLTLALPFVLSDCCETALEREESDSLFTSLLLFCKVVARGEREMDFSMNVLLLSDDFYYSWCNNTSSYAPLVAPRLWLI